MSRVENAAGEKAVKEPMPRAPELEIPRPSGAGVGARLNLAFELNICPECGWRLIEHNGLLVCEGCGLVLAPVYEPPKFKPAGSFNVFNGFGGAPHISSGGLAHGLAQRALEALAGELGVPAGAVLEVYKRLKRAGVGEAAAIALFVTAKRCGSYISLKRACELLSKCGVKAEYPRAVRIMLAHAPLIRPTAEEALEAYAAKLGISESVKREALAILAKVKPYAGGRDPYLVALAAIYLSSGTFSIYGLAKLAGRSPSRLHENIRFISEKLRGGA